MNKKVTGYIAIIIIFLCIAYIVFDIATGRSEKQEAAVTDVEENTLETPWQAVKEFSIDYGILSSVALTADRVICAGDSFLATYDTNLAEIWNLQLEKGINAVAVYGDTIYVATKEEIILFALSGSRIDTWGPYDDEPVLTSISVNSRYVAIADAGNRLVFVLNKDGALESIAGHPGNQFIIPSPYFDVAITEEDTLLTANTGKRNIEFRAIDGTLVRAIGKAGASFDDFCGCCNPAHFAVFPDGNIATGEKGVNRIKIIRSTGELVEPVAQPDNFKPSVPVDLAISKEGLIYAANRDNSTLYIFKRGN